MREVRKFWVKKGWIWIKEKVVWKGKIIKRWKGKEIERLRKMNVKEDVIEVYDDLREGDGVVLGLKKKEVVWWE